MYLPSRPEKEKELQGKLELTGKTQFETYYELISVENRLGSASNRKVAISEFISHQNDQIIFELLGRLQSK